MRKLAGKSSLPGEPVELILTLQYADGLSPKERDPAVFVYLTEPVACKGSYVELPEDEAETQLAVPLTGSVSAGNVLPLDTKVMFYATCVKDNDFGSPCRVTAGMAAVPLRDILDSPGRFSRDLMLRLYQAGGQVKGKLRVSVSRHQANVSARIPWEPMHVAASLPAIDSSGALLPVEQEMVTYIKVVLQIESSFPNTYEETGNVRIPIYYGDVGLMRPEAPLPAAAYFMAKVPDSNRLFWSNALEVVMARESRVAADLSSMSLIEQARVMADINCLVIHGVDYIPDTVDGNVRPIHGVAGFVAESVASPYDQRLVQGGESFGNALRDSGDDCEDVASAIGCQVFRAFQRADFTGHAQLLRLQEISTQYVAVCSLDTVTSAAAKSDDERSTASFHKRKLGAHLKCQFFPAPYVKECIERACANVDTSGSTVLAEAVRSARSLPYRDAAPYARDLPVLIAEGTGMYQTLGVPVDPIQGERACVYQTMPSLQFAKKPIVHPPGADSSFFVGSMVGFTTYWYDQGVPSLGMWMGYTDDKNRFVRGVGFRDLSNASPKMALLPHPQISTRVMDWIERRVRMRVPPRDLILTPEGMAAQPDHDPTIDAICAHAESMKRAPAIRQPPVPVYFQSHQLTPAVVNALKRDISSNRAVTSVSYVCEHITDWMHIYRVGISANAK